MKVVIIGVATFLSIILCIPTTATHAFVTCSGRRIRSAQQQQSSVLLRVHSKTKTSFHRLAAVSSADNIDKDDLQLVQDLVLASSLSYLSLGETGRKPMKASPYFAQAVERNLQPITQVVDEASQSGATLFALDDDNNNTIIVACRGSANLQNFQTNLQFSLVEVENALLVGNESSVIDNTTTSMMLIHAGFQKASIGLWKVLHPELKKAIQQQPKSRVIFTGHSLGAATALLTAVQYSLSGMVPSSVITFGGPRLCNEALAQHWMQKCFTNKSIVVANLVHSKDPILQQNQALWDALGFAIVGEEVLCESDKAVVYEWEEEEAKQQSTTTSVGTSKLDKSELAFNFWDHCMYLGTFVGPRII